MDGIKNSLGTKFGQRDFTSLEIPPGSFSFYQMCHHMGGEMLFVCFWTQEREKKICFPSAALAVKLTVDNQLKDEVNSHSFSPETFLLVIKKKRIRMKF